MGHHPIRSVAARPPARRPSPRPMWILLDLNDSDIRIARPNRVTKKHTKRRKTTHPPASPVVWTRLVDRVDPMRRGDNIYRPAHHARCRARPFTHACARAVARVIRSRRVRETTRRLDRSHPFVRSVASIRSHRIPLAHRSRRARFASARSIADSAPRAVASSARIVDRGLVDRRISVRAFSRGRRRRAPTRGVDGTCRFSFVYSFVRATRTRTRSTTTTTKATRARDAIDRRARRRGVGRETRRQRGGI